MSTTKTNEKYSINTVFIKVADFHLRSKKFGLAMEMIRLLDDGNEKSLRIKKIYNDYCKYNNFSESEVSDCLDTIRNKIELYSYQGEYFKALDVIFLLPEKKEIYAALRKIYINSICDGNLICAELVANLLPKKERLIYLRNIFLTYIGRSDFINARSILDQLPENEKVKHLLLINDDIY